MTDLCAGCGAKLPDEIVLRSISHTIKPGQAVLCSACGAKESTAPAWASARAFNWKQVEAAMRVPDLLKKHHIKEGVKQKKRR